MTPEEWRELEALGKIRIEVATSADILREADLFACTEWEDQHPDDYNGPCFCRGCRSYADE
jgi:hypothetical protein